MKNYLFLLLLITTSIVSGKERYYFSNLSLEKGLSQITVGPIMQDSRGFMWFGTRNGLNRFDGHGFDVFQTKEDDDSSISDNHILCMTEDDSENIWVGTNNGLNKLNLATLKIERYFGDSDNPNSIPHSTILSIYFDNKNRSLWIGTNRGLCLYDKEKDSFENILNENFVDTRIDVITRHGDNLYVGARFKGVVVYNIKTKKDSLYKHIEEDPRTIADDYIKAILMDSRNNLWVGTRNSGVSILKNGTDVFEAYNQENGLNNNYVRCITESPDGEILISTFNGLNVVNPQTWEIDRYTNFGAGQGNLSHYSIISTYFDKAQTLWVGTYAGGVCYYNKSGEKFRFYNPSSQMPVLGIIGPIIEVEDKLYIATEGTGLLEMNKHTETFVSHKIFEGTNSPYQKNIIKSICRDGDKILCGTNLGAVYSFDLKSKKYNLIYDLKAEQSIYYLGLTQSGDLVIGGVNDNGLILLSKKDGTSRNTFPVKGKPDVAFPDVRSFCEIEKNVFLVGTRNNGLYYYDYNNQILKEYRSSNSDSYQRIPNNYVTSIIKDSRGNIWIGTFGGGISSFNSEFGEFATYDIRDGLHDNNVCSIVEGEEKHLWISTISGLSEFDAKTRVFNNYTHSNGIKVDEFTLHAGLKLSSGNIVFSGNNGFILFDPEKILFNTFIPPIALRHLYVNSKEVLPGDKNGILTEQLDRQKTIVLKYNESNITIGYCALNFVFSDRNQYAYILEGFDRDWNQAGSRREAYYTNIPPGEYTFRVKGSNNDNLWNNEGTDIRIIVKPPFWKTWWAYTLYALLVMGIILFIIRYFSEKKRLQDDIKMKQVEAKASEEFHQARNKLFTNFSHELRTPLTLIINPLDDMEAKADLSPEILDNVHLMQNNARRLLRIVNNLMDFQKKESGTMKLQISEGDFIEFTNEMTIHFRELAVSRKIHFTFSPTIDTQQYWFDKNLMEKVYFNFLSNAFKNVPNQGMVEVNVDTKSLDELKTSFPEKIESFSNSQIQYIVLEIKNSGDGIIQDDLEKIFIPFYQVAQNEHSASGTGLGLSLSKSIIEMHHGIVWAESPNASGAIFRCILPVDKDLFGAEDFADEIKNASDFPYSVDISKENSAEDDAKKKVYTILVVEDNIDVRRYIVSHLKKTYNIVEASNGVEAAEKTLIFLPDLIISDLMMPKMDGMEFCEKIKNDIRTSHIPIIMLTAKTMSEDVKQGYEVGADDYITKPFNSSVLVSRVNNIIQSREKLKKLYGKHFSLETLGVEATSVDEKFMQKLYDILEENISNPELTLNGFCRDIGMSRANLYRKVKAITNLSPNEFIRNFRLNMGAKMLKEARMPVSEVYVAVGFNSHAYFSNCFKAYYGISPSEYANQQTESK